MQYVMLIYQGENWARVPNEEKNRVHAACGAWHEQLVKSGHSRAAYGLQPASTARTLRASAEKITLTDGPFAETKEVLGGFEILECCDLDEAIALAKKFPALRSGCVVEIRPHVTGDVCRD